MAHVAPSAMILVPYVGGISRNQIEDAKPENLTAGLQPTPKAVLDCSNAVSPREEQDAHRS